MAVTVSVTGVIQEPLPSTRVLINFSDGTQWEFTDKASLLAQVGDIDTNPDLARKFGLARWANNNPNLNNPQNLVGHSCTINIAATPVVSFA